MERGNLPTSRANWMIGAYHMGDGEYKEAVVAFQLGSAFALKANALGDEMLNQGYALKFKLLD